MTLGELIKIKRNARGLTQAALAQRLNLSMQAVSKWERDLSKPSSANFPFLAECLGVDVQMLINADVLPEIQPRTFESEFVQQGILYVYRKRVPIKDILPLLNILDNIVPLNSSLDKLEAKRSEYLTSFQKQEEIDLAQKIFEIIVSRSAAISVPALKYGTLKHTGISEYPLGKLTSVFADMRNFARYDVIRDAFADRQTCPIAIFQDSPFHLLRFGISQQQAYIFIDRNNRLLEDGGVYLYSCTKGTFIAGFSNTLTDNYSIESDLAESVVSKEERESIHFQIIGKVLEFPF